MLKWKKITQKSKNCKYWCRLKKEEEIEPLSNFDIIKLARNLKIKHFRDVFMKCELPRKVKNIECGIINLQNSDESGSHWVAFYKIHDKK
jgi:hypothetical protein